MLMPDESQPRSPKGDDSEYGTVVIGLLAPPQVPREFVEGLADELPGVLSERISDRVSWEIPTVRDTRLPDVEYGEEGGDETIDDVSEWRRHEGWDLAICLTDLPIRTDGRAVIAGASPRRDAALVSLPALGVIHRRRRALEEIVRLVSELRSDNVEPAREGEESRNGGTNGHTVSSDDENLQLVMPAEVSKVRLLAGMVRATHPFRVVLGLSYALTAALGTAAFTIITNTIWQLRGRANRSRSARRAALPTILSPGFSNESAHDDDRVREGDPEVDDLPSPLCAPHQLLVSVIPGVGSLHNPTFRGL